MRSTACETTAGERDTGGHEVNLAVGKGDVHPPLRFLPIAKERGDAWRDRRPRPGQTVRGLLHDALQGGDGVDQRVVLRVFLLFGGSKLFVDQPEKRIQIGRFREFLDEGPVILEGLLQLLQIVFRHEQQRLAPQRRQVPLVKHVGEQIGFPLHSGCQPLHELAIAFHVAALHHHGQFVLPRKFLAEFHVNLVGAPPTRLSLFMSTAQWVAV